MDKRQRYISFVSDKIFSQIEVSFNSSDNFLYVKFPFAAIPLILIRVRRAYYHGGRIKDIFNEHITSYYGVPSELFDDVFKSVIDRILYVHA